MSEEEARKKWCPFTRSITTTVDDIPSTNGSLKFECIASDCMAWRWLLTEKPGRHIPLGVKERVTGYCGLAGEPT